MVISALGILFNGHIQTAKDFPAIISMRQLFASPINRFKEIVPNERVRSGNAAKGK